MESLTATLCGIWEAILMVFNPIINGVLKWVNETNREIVKYGIIVLMCVIGLGSYILHKFAKNKGAPIWLVKIIIPIGLFIICSLIVILLGIS